MSEVAELRKQIALECEAMKIGIQGFRVVATHEFIKRQYATIGGIYEQLAALVGEHEATRITVEIYNQVFG